MKINSIFLSALLALCIAVGTGQGEASAQSTGCLSLHANIGQGATDAAANGTVGALQAFLVAQGDFSASNLGSGHFGPLTRASVIRFQASHGISGTGYVGPLTRAAIAHISCAAAPAPVPNPAPATSTPSVQALAPAATSTPSQLISITGLDSPPTLVPHQLGTWAIHVDTGNYAGKLNYSVQWDDGQPVSTASAIVGSSTSAHTSPPFTHEYLYLGTYNPTFTVTDQDNQRATSTSAAINLTTY